MKKTDAVKYSIDLSYNRISATGLNHLSKLLTEVKNIRMLDLRFNLIGKDAKEAFTNFKDAAEKNNFLTTLKLNPQSEGGSDIMSRIEDSVTVEARKQRKENMPKQNRSNNVLKVHKGVQTLAAAQEQKLDFQSILSFLQRYESGDIYNCLRWLMLLLRDTDRINELNQYRQVLTRIAQAYEADPTGSEFKNDIIDLETLAQNSLVTSKFSSTLHRVVYSFVHRVKDHYFVVNPLSMQVAQLQEENQRLIEAEAKQQEQFQQENQGLREGLAKQQEQIEFLMKHLGSLTQPAQPAAVSEDKAHGIPVPLAAPVPHSQQPLAAQSLTPPVVSLAQNNQHLFAGLHVSPGQSHSESELAATP